MNIALIGYGKMGQTIERIATGRGHTVVLRITTANRDSLTAGNLRNVDVAIEFTSPEAAPVNVAACLSAGVSVVSGSTGWNDQLEEAGELARSHNAALLHASNFSVGVNIFFQINQRLAQLMKGQPEYKASIEEVHHLQKKDAPSGTAITLADQIISESDRLCAWALAEDAGADTDLPVTAIREEGVPGTHRVSWASAVDTIDIVHTAHSRDGFALGAVLAAEFIRGRQGVFSMSNVLGL